MLKIIPTILLPLFYTVGFGQENHSDLPSSPSMSYELRIDKSSVKDWENTTQFVRKITQAEQVSLAADSTSFKIQTSRVLDPKIIEGKLIKFGVIYFELKKN